MTVLLIMYLHLLSKNKIVILYINEWITQFIYIKQKNTFFEFYIKKCNKIKLWYFNYKWNNLSFIK